MTSPFLMCKFWQRLHKNVIIKTAIPYFLKKGGVTHMKFVWLIAIILGLSFGFSVAANFVAAVLLGGMVIGFLGCLIQAIVELCKLQILEAIIQILGAVFWGWLLSICFWAYPKKVFLNRKTFFFANREDPFWQLFWMSVEENA